MSNESKSFIIRCKDFFGLKEGQKLSDLMKEVKELTQADRKEILDAFNAAGLPTHDGNN